MRSKRTEKLLWRCFSSTPKYSKNFKKMFSNNRLMEKDGDFWIMKYKQLVVDVIQTPCHIILTVG
jgi:hypothetical protein